MEKYLIIKNSLFTTFGIIVGVSGAISFIQTDWGNYKIDFFFWWSIFSTILSVVFLLTNAVQFVGSSKEKEIHKSQVKIWQHHANGLFHGLFAIVQGRFSSVDDIQQAAKITQANANSLYTSLNEERLFTEQEIKEKQLKSEEEFKKMISQNKN